MSDRLRNITVTIVFLIAVFGLCAANLARPLNDISYTERRRLARPPQFRLATVMDGTAFAALDGFLTDQFTAREQLRALKALALFGIYARGENNSIAIAGGSAIKVDYELREAAVAAMADKLNGYYQRYFAGSQCYFALIPDKNFYLAEPYGYPAMDYDRMSAILRDNLSAGIHIIDIGDTLDSDSYYSTDLHWRQECLGGAVNRLAQAMGFAPADLSQYRQNVIEGFYGAFYGQSALPLKPDALVYLTGAATDTAEVYNYETNAAQAVYRPDLFDGVDPYDVFLSGATPLIRITNPLGDGGRLIVFRDSFGSSIVPLLIESYSEITVIDTRYMAPELIPQYVDIAGQDVLFLYSASVVNNSEMIR